MECQTLESYDENHNPILKSKLKFETLDLAIEHAKKVNSLDHIIHKVVAYKCKQCHKYHVGRNGKELTEKERNKFKMAKQNRFI
jgi:predicted CXXCH cytochrome family protein